MSTQRRAEQVRRAIQVALGRLEVPEPLAFDVARRLPFKIGERFLKELDRIFHGGNPGGR